MTVVRFPTTSRPKRAQIGVKPRASREPLIAARGSISVRKNITSTQRGPNPNPTLKESVPSLFAE